MRNELFADYIDWRGKHPSDDLMSEPHAQQVLFGLGFTTEHPLRRFARRALVLDGLLGSSRTLTNEVGAEALRTRRLPGPSGCNGHYSSGS